MNARDNSSKSDSFYSLGFFLATTTTVVITILQFVFSAPNPIQIIQIIGWCLFVAGFTLVWMPSIYFRRYGSVNKGDAFINTTKVVDKGIYGIVRHPQYLGWMMIIAFVMCINQHWLIITIGVIGISGLYLIMIREERALSERLGESYDIYTKHVPRVNLILGLIRKHRN